MFCKRCGKEIPENSIECPFCNSETKTIVVQSDTGITTFIPKNPPALWAYYLGIFSLLCGITSIPALILGIKGLKYEKEHPEAHGGIHSWVGIIISAITLLIFLSCFFLLLVS